MAFRAMMQGHWKWMGKSPFPTSRSFASSATTTTENSSSKTTANSSSRTTATSLNIHQPCSNYNNNKYQFKMDDAPLYIILGFVGVAICMAAHGLKQNVMHAPGVVINKKKRESLFEADNPDQALASANKFLDKSFLRKVSNIQDSTKQTIPFTRPDPFSRPRTAESLKSVGIDPSRR